MSFISLPSTDSLEGRWDRFTVLPGFDGPALSGLRDARVLVIGAGGLGSAVLPAIVAAGVGEVHVVDDDVVEASNLPRQSLHGAADVGRSKVDSAVETLTALGAGVVVGHRERFTAETGPSLLENIDLIVDGSDNFDTRYLVDDLARGRGIPVVWGAVSQYGGQVGLSWEGRGPTYRDLFPEPPAPGTVLSCAEGGILPTVCTVAGALMAAQVLAVLSGTTEPLLGKVTSYDARTARTRELAYGADPDAPWRTAAGRSGTADTLGDAPAEPGEATLDEEKSTMTADATPAADWQTADEIDATTLDALRRSGTEFQLIDVRETWEREIAAIDGAISLPMSSTTREDVEALDPDVPIIVYCHHGGRSERMLAAFRGAGLTGTHLQGGIDSWARIIDPSIARY
ncbi:ThiF family adenylyltransferase [Amnibacterium flavum]|uniref:Molybdopterin biosynthesis protein MoeB n=1 Tax=Amnibacterium flavum TaxID=2173173 RepID=A0A2V1HW58_9MICO|nr:ThiF family adenylyltransferase [Amnibacterium flavum]PVZ96062.1 molybdopterin biosynthesis protein MoeB [Amnibacterium flavum]